MSCSPCMSKWLTSNLTPKKSGGALLDIAQGTITTADITSAIDSLLPSSGGPIREQQSDWLFSFAAEFIDAIHRDGEKFLRFVSPVKARSPTNQKQNLWRRNNSNSDCTGHSKHVPAPASPLSTQSNRPQMIVGGGSEQRPTESLFPPLPNHKDPERRPSQLLRSFSPKKTKSTAQENAVSCDGSEMKKGLDSSCAKKSVRRGLILPVETNCSVSPEVPFQVAKVTENHEKFWSRKPVTVGDFISTRNSSGKRAKKRVAPTPVPIRKTSKSCVQQTSEEKFLSEPFNMDSKENGHHAFTWHENTDLTALNRCASVFGVFMDRGYFVDFLAECTFLLRLLMCKEMSSSGGNVLKDCNAAVYFAQATLACIQSMLLLLDTKFLTDLKKAIHNRKPPFPVEPDFNLWEALEITLEERKLRSSFAKGVTAKTVHIQGIGYDMEKEGKDKWPNDASFHNAKRQRASFNNLLKKWEVLREESENFESCCGADVRRMLTISRNPHNLAYLSRLLTTQLLKCSRERILEDGTEWIIAKGKLATTDNSFISSVNFPYYDFFLGVLEASSDPSFLEHFKDELLGTILDIMEKSNQEEYRDWDYEMDSKMSHRLHVLQILGHFLGYIVFLPYRGMEVSYANNMRSTPRLRNRLESAFSDVIDISITEGRLILALPWIVHYSLMADSVSLASSEMVDLANRLFFLRLKVHDYFTDSCVILYTKTLMSYFLALLTTPPSLPFRVRSPPDKVPSVDSQLKLSSDTLELLFPGLKILNTTLHNADDADEEIYRPYKEVRFDVLDQQKFHPKDAQDILCENFLHCHPQTKHAVEYLIERIEIMGIQRIRNQLLPTIVEEGVAQVKKNQISSERIAIACARRCEKDAFSILTSIAKRVANGCIPLLLGEPEGDALCRISKAIVLKSAPKKPMRWVNAYVNKTYFIKSFQSVIREFGNVSTTELVLTDSKRLKTTAQINDENKAMTLAFEDNLPCHVLSELQYMLLREPVLTVDMILTLFDRMLLCIPLALDATKNALRGALMRLMLSCCASERRDVLFECDIRSKCLEILSLISDQPFVLADRRKFFFENLDPSVWGLWEAFIDDAVTRGIVDACTS